LIFSPSIGAHNSSCITHWLLQLIDAAHYSEGPAKAQ
jgi:hypothetical protein